MAQTRALTRGVGALTGLLNNHCGIDRLLDGVTLLTVSNAGRSNILSGGVVEGLIAGLAALAREDDLRVLVLTGAGDATFIGGADIREMETFDPPAAERFIARLRDLCEAVRRFPAPVLARIGGWCLGGGLELAMACDLRVASEFAKFAIPEVKIGIPSVIHAALMPRLIGMARARRLILTGMTIDAATALDWGPVDAVAAPEKLDAEVTRAIAPILECGQHAIRAQKVLLRQWEELPLAEAVAASIPVFGRAFATGEPQYFMRQFLAAKSQR
jgi:enoyl-CoA hydratase/carnithine racemase